MTEHTISQNETVDIAGPSGTGHNHLLRVQGAEITIETSDDFVTSGTIIEDNDRAIVALPPAAVLYAHNANATPAVVQIYDQGVNDLSAGDHFAVDYMPRRVFSLSSGDLLQTVTPNLPGTDQGHTTVPTPGTVEQLASGTSPIPNGFAVAVKALNSNEGLVYVGEPDIDSSDGFELAAGEGVKLYVDDLTAVAVDAENAGDGVCWIHEEAGGV